MPDPRPTVKPAIRAAVLPPAKPVAPIRDRVVIENGTVAALAGNPAAVKEFPFLAAVRDAKGGCGSCGGNKSKPKEAALASAKKGIAGLADDRRRVLLGFLGARSATVVYRTGEGVAREVELR